MLLRGVCQGLELLSLDMGKDGVWSVVFRLPDGPVKEVYRSYNEGV